LIGECEAHAPLIFESFRRRGIGVDFPIKEVILFQSAMEILLLVLLLVILRRMAKAKERESSDPASMPDELQKTIERFLTESSKIAQTFSQNLEDKKNLSADLILKLDKRLKGYRELLKETEASFTRAVKDLQELKQKEAATKAPEKYVPLEPRGEDKANPAAGEVRALVLKLAREGASVEDIAVKARLDRGEVELILELEGQFNL
jgi:hypothetical protein